MKTYFLVALAVLSLAVPAGAQQVTKQTVEGISNLSRVETTVACAGAITPAAMSEIRKMGFVSVINLRQASEPGADIETHQAAAKAAGLRYYHVPFNGASPDAKVAQQFLAAITTKGAEPAFIHCASANRASAMWLIKRIVIDRWDVERATAEATALGLSNGALRTWALDYARSAK